MSRLFRIANRFFRHTLQEDDNQDQIGSNSPTPTGITTPQPDPTDKRQPSIMHNPLQVGSSFGPKSTSNMPEIMAAANQSGAHVTQTPQGSSGRSSASSGSLVMMGQGEASNLKASALSDKKTHDPETNPVSLPPTNLPTPPHCSAHSLLQKDSDVTEMTSSAPDKGMGSTIFTALKSYLAAPPETTTTPDTSARRHTSHPVSSISGNPVLASHFSNPCLPALCSQDVPLPDHDKPPRVSMSSDNLAKLTLNVADASHLKNTPPLTPRAMSNDGSQSEKKPPSSYPQQLDPSKPQQTDDWANATEEITGKLNQAFPSNNPPGRSESPQSGPPVGSIKGKLLVTICEARGLRPGFDPYVVCVFESNEVISKSAHDEEEASMERQQKEQEKSDLESGRPMAIPMKSRQSSSNSLPSLLDEHKGKGLMTDPHWNHEATLYVSFFVDSTKCEC